MTGQIHIHSTSEFSVLSRATSLKGLFSPIFSEEVLVSLVRSWKYPRQTVEARWIACWIDMQGSPTSKSMSFLLTPGGDIFKDSMAAWSKFRAKLFLRETIFVCLVISKMEKQL